jgi:hypothetical protein
MLYGQWITNNQGAPTMTEQEPDILDMAFMWTDDELAQLPADLCQEVMDARATLDAVDRAWQAPPEAIERVHRLFLEKLPPGHPWRKELQNE